MSPSLHLPGAIGVLSRINGRVYCHACAVLGHPAASEEHPVYLYPVNILPYSQDCAACGNILVQGTLRRTDGAGLLMLFD